jgi:hypothetical protein
MAEPAPYQPENLTYDRKEPFATGMWQMMNQLAVNVNS